MAPYPVSGTAEVLERYAYGREEQARAELVARYRPLVRNISRRYWAAREPQEDLLQVGMLGLLNAIEKFDLALGTSFAALAIPEIRGAILNHLRDHGSAIKVPRGLQRARRTVDKVASRMAPGLGRWPAPREIADECDLTEAEVDAAIRLGYEDVPFSLDRGMDGGDGDDSPTLADSLGQEDVEFDRAVLGLTLQSALKTLSATEQTIMRLRYYEGKTQRETAEKVSVSQMHVSRLDRGALAKIRAVMDTGSGDAAVQWPTPSIAKAS